MNKKKEEWPLIFLNLREAGISRTLIPFLTEYGGSQDWDHLNSELEPATYQGKQIRTYMDL
jgi:hypothetical protein